MSDGLDSLAGWPGTRPRRRLDEPSRAAAPAPATRRWPFALASVTKLLTATAVLVAVQEEIVELDEPAGPPGSTVRLLLCHASGLPFEGSEPIAAPGRGASTGTPPTRCSATLVAERAGVPFADYVREGVLEPLGMGATTVTGSPAHGARSTLDDLLRFAGELLDPGRVLAPELLAEATTPQLPDLDGVLPGFGRQRPNPWGLGFELKGTKAPHWTPAGGVAAGPSGTSGSPARSSGSIRTPGVAVRGSGRSSPSATGRWRRGPPWDRRCWRPRG